MPKVSFPSKRGFDVKVGGRRVPSLELRFRRGGGSELLYGGGRHRLQFEGDQEVLLKSVVTFVAGVIASERREGPL